MTPGLCIIAAAAAAVAEVSCSGSAGAEIAEILCSGSVGAEVAEVSCSGSVGGKYSANICEPFVSPGVLSNNRQILACATPCYTHVPSMHDPTMLRSKPFEWASTQIELVVGSHSGSCSLPLTAVSGVKEIARGRFATAMDVMIPPPPQEACRQHLCSVGLHSACA